MYAIKSLEFICEILETMQNASKCESESLKKFRVSIRVYAVKRLKALALDSKLIQIVSKSQP